MFSVVALLLLGAGFVAGYAVRAHVSRRKRTRRVFLPHVAHFPSRENSAKTHAEADAES